MKMNRINIQLPAALKAKRGTTAAGLIRHLLEKHFQQTAK